MATKRICHTCGKQYEYCPACGKYRSLPKWMINWCGQECKDVFDVLTNYHMGDANKEDVQTVLDIYGSNPGKYSDKIKGQLDEILSKKKAKKPEIEE